ncbi:enoyl-CoA hydratase/isomerase family protein [Yinghuangia sp. YIM S09857]|uniref:enoyl-CoA hydratase/isomerase family protein n=1 Tax=Yinghuangia sp. YIM S09857 TaxID=3436929 RepID=UPI003F52B4B7
MSEPTDLRTHRDGDGVVTVTLNRPKRRNALTGRTMEELATTLARIGNDPHVRCVILTGERGFCSGVDIDWLNAVPAEQILEQGVDFYRLPQSTVRALLALPVPTIAAIDGPAVGLGLDLALACDSRFIGPEGWLRQGWAAGGLIPATGGVHLMDSLAPGVIWQLLDGQPKIDGHQAHRLDLGEPASDTALAAARARAAHLAQIPPTAIRGYVTLCRARIRRGWEEHLRTTAEIQLTLFSEGHYRAALTGQLDRRQNDPNHSAP